MYAAFLMVLGIALVAVGFILMFLSVLLPVLRGRRGARISGGGIILIGPFPIVIGTKDITKALIAITVAFVILTLIISIVLAFSLQF